jgi:DNA repair protein RecO (recombination protein O)
MTHKTKGIVLRSIKYGETSLVVTLFTALFGVQTYMVNGVRSTKKSMAKANHFQPAALLELVVYHSPGRSMQRIKEFGWGRLYNTLLHDVIANSVASYLVELLYKCLKQPEANPELFEFCEDVFSKLDENSAEVTANLALFFSVQLPHFFGFRMTDNYSEKNNFLDLMEGTFTEQQPHHPHFMEGEPARVTSQLLKVMHPDELVSIRLNRESRRNLLLKYQDYYALHLPEFGQMKTLVVLHEVL